MSIVNEAVTYGNSGIPHVQYQTVPIKDIMVYRESVTHNTPSRVTGMELKGVDKPINCTDRFINSFLGLFGLSKSIFNLFDHEEVVERLLTLGKGDKVRLALQINQNDSYTALAAIKPSKPYVESFDLYDLLNKMGIPDDEIGYTLGVVRSTHVPSVMGNSEVDIVGDVGVRRFVMDIPIDGYGAPSAYLSIIRQICSNGMVGEAPAFRSQVNIGDGGLGLGANDAIPTIRKFIEAHNNEEGFHVLTDRMRTAVKTPASLDEFNKLYRLITGQNMDGLHRKVSSGVTSSTDLSSDVSQVMYNLAGRDLMERYGLVSLDQLSPKKRKLVPVECTVMDLINVASELATHRADDYQNKKISGFVGQTLSEEFDLEGAVAEHSKNTDLYMTSYRDAHANDDTRQLP